MGNIDIHCCGDCKVQFNSLEQFLVHKLTIERYALSVEESDTIPGLSVPIFSKLASVDESTEPSEVVDEVEVYDAGELSEGEMVVDSPTEVLKIDERLASPQVSVPENETRDDGITEIEDNGCEISGCKPVKCLICGHRYKNKVILKVHKRTVHSAQKPYSCSICSVAFKTKGSLTRHQRRHTDERPYACSACGKGFRESGSLTRHLKSILPCNAFNKAVHKDDQNTDGAEKTKLGLSPKPTSVNVLITRLVALSDEDGSRVISVANEAGDNLQRKVVELTLKQTDAESGRGELVISEK